VGKREKEKKIEIYAQKYYADPLRSSLSNDNNNNNNQLQATTSGRNFSILSAIHFFPHTHTQLLPPVSSLSAIFLSNLSPFIHQLDCPLAAWRHDDLSTGDNVLL